MDKEFLDKLNRAFEMEEEMVSKLIELCQQESLSAILCGKDRQFVEKTLSIIRYDTLRHKKIVSGIKEGLS
ncbi:MAG: hypothetical protein WC412_09200 [Candidatus Omnitrophota bacterium]|jgi:hypothetical protein